MRPLTFEPSSSPLQERDIRAIEHELGLVLPRPVRELYLRSNGGTPDPYVYEDDSVDTVVTEFLPLKAGTGVETAVDVYRSLVSSKRIVDARFFPFAVDGGGDYFFVDCASDDGQVFLYRHDSVTPGLLALARSFVDFWRHLKPE